TDKYLEEGSDYRADTSNNLKVEKASKWPRHACGSKVTGRMRKTARQARVAECAAKPHDTCPGSHRATATRGGRQTDSCSRPAERMDRCCRSGQGLSDNKTNPRSKVG